MESPLTFAALDAKLEEMAQHSPAFIDMPKKARWGFVIGFSAATIGLLAAKLLPSNHISTMIISATSLVVELAGLGIGFAAQLPRSWPTFAGERREAADELDSDMPRHRELILWIQGHPRKELEELSEYASYRLERLRERLPLLTGGIEKLGALPVFVALFIQFKDAQWPPHPSWIEMALMFVLVLAYWMSLLQIYVRFRLQTYDVVLKKALKELR